MQPETDMFTLVFNKKNQFFVKMFCTNASLAISLQQYDTFFLARLLRRETRRFFIPIPIAMQYIFDKCQKKF